MAAGYKAALFFALALPAFFCLTRLKRGNVNKARTSKKQKQRVVVTGCSGSIGQPVCTWLTKCGHEVTGFDIVAAPSLEGVCKVIIGDICDRHAVSAALAGADVMIHLATCLDIKDADGDPVDFVDRLLLPNVKGLCVCAEEALQAGVGRIVLAPATVNKLHQLLSLKM